MGAGAAHQAHEDRFGQIVARVAQSDGVGAPAPGLLQQCGMAGIAPLGFGRSVTFGCRGAARNPKPLDDAGQVHGSREALDKTRVRRGSPPAQPMIDMGNAKMKSHGGRQAVQDVKQAD